MLYYLLIYMFSYLQYINSSKLKNKSLHTLYKHYYPLIHHIYTYNKPKKQLVININSDNTCQ